MHTAAHTHTKVTKLLIDSTQTLPQTWTSVYCVVFSSISVSLSASLSRLETSAVWQLNQAPPRARKRERWVKNKGERRQKTRGGGWGGETISRHHFLLCFCCFSSICFLSPTFQFQTAIALAACIVFLVKSPHLIVYEINTFTSVCLAVNSLSCFSVLS